MRIPVQLISQSFMEEYSLYEKIHKDHIYFEIRKFVYGLTQAERIENYLLKQHITPFG